jgi:hypothetical protein
MLTKRSASWLLLEAGAWGHRRQTCQREKQYFGGLVPKVWMAAPTLPNRILENDREKLNARPIPREFVCGREKRVVF